MSLTATIISALVVASAAGLVAWVWLAMTRVQNDLRSFCVLPGMDFDIRRETDEHRGDTR